jgi:hypothetical protein
LGLIGRRKDSNASAKPEMRGRCAPAHEYTGDEGEDRVGRRVFRILIDDRTQSDLDDGELQDDEGKQIPWKKISWILHKEAPRLQIAALDAFRRDIADQVSFGNSFHLPVAYEFVDKADLAATFNKGGWWTDFYEKYPKSQGFLTLSRAGFSPDGEAGPVLCEE